MHFHASDSNLVEDVSQQKLGNLEELVMGGWCRSFIWCLVSDNHTLQWGPRLRGHVLFALK